MNCAKADTYPITVRHPYLWRFWRTRPFSAWLSPGRRSWPSRWARWWRCCRTWGRGEWWAELWCAGSGGPWGSAGTTNAAPWSSSPWNALSNCWEKKKKSPEMTLLKKSSTPQLKLRGQDQPRTKMSIRFAAFPGWFSSFDIKVSHFEVRLDQKNLFRSLMHLMDLWF